MAYADLYNCNENRKYPFAPTVDNKLIFGVDYNLNDEVILDAGFTIGANTEFAPDTHNVALTQIDWTPTKLTFTFSVLPGTAEFVFTRKKTDVKGATEYVEADGDPANGIGYLVTGDLYGIILELDTLYGTTGSIPANLVVNVPKVELSTIINVGGQRVESVNVANLERYQVDACCDTASNYDDFVGHEVASGLVGDVKFHAGYNADIAVDPSSNVMTLNADQGAGDGEPCEEVLRWPDETAPEGSSILSGGPSCGDLIFRVNGVIPTDNGVFALNGGDSISVVSYPEEHRIDIINNIETSLYCVPEE